MKLLDGHLYLAFPDLEGYGCSHAYLSKVAYEYREGKTKSWVNIYDEKDGRKVLFLYDAIPVKTINAKAIPTKAELIRQMRDAELERAAAHTQTTADVLRSLLKPLSDVDRLALATVEIGRDRADRGTGEVLKREQTALPEKKLKEYAGACRWLALLADARWRKEAERRKLSPALATWPDFQAAVIAAFTQDGVKLPKNARKLTAKVAEYKAQGARAVVPLAKWGNANARKVNDEVLEMLIKLYSDPRKPSFELVAAWFNQLATRRMGLGLEPWPELSVGAVKTNLLEKDVKAVWTLRREGFEYWKSQYEYTALRFRPSERDMLWVVDGTKVNYYYRTPTGIAAKLNVVVVLDAHSDKFLGWAFCEKEDATAVAGAMRMALRTAGHRKPRQVQYDNGSANISFFQGWGGLHFPAMPHNGQSKIIERALGAIQQQVMRANANFTGANITATSQAGKANTELLRELVKGGQLPTREEAMQQAALDFHIWNNLPARRDGKTPNERYSESMATGAADVVTVEEERAAFWVWSERPVTYRRDGLTMELNRTRYHYEVRTAKGELDQDFMARWIGQAFRIKYDPDQPGAAVALYVAEDRLVALATAKEALPMAVGDYEPGSRTKINAALDAKKEQRARALDRLTAIAEGLDAEELAKMGNPDFIPQDVLKAAREEAEEAGVTVPAAPSPLPGGRQAPAPRADAAWDAITSMDFE